MLGGAISLSKDAMKEKGDEGEKALNDWLNANGLSYLYIRQAEKDQPTLFRGVVKKPDFLVLLESIGLIAVDAKNYRLSRGEYTLGYEKEVKKVLAFERLFRIPVWYAYFGTDDTGPWWYWISALRALEVGERRKKGDGTEFLSIKIEEFCTIKTNADLGLLYTQRLPRVEKIAAEIVGEPLARPAKADVTTQEPHSHDH